MIQSLFKEQPMLMFRLSGLVWLFVVMLLSVSFPVYAETVGEIAKSEVFKASSIGFAEPFVATKDTSSTEDQAVLAAIKGHQARKSVDDYQALTGFLEKYPDSGWSLAVSTNLGWIYYQSGRFSKAIDIWERAWQLGKAVKDDNPKAKALADRALGELFRMHARIGHKDRLAALFTDMGKRPVSGSATEYVAGAKEGLWLMQNKPSVAYLCGPMALKNLLLSQGKDLSAMTFLTDYQSGEHGVSLKEVEQLAEQANIPHLLVKRSAGQKVPVPSVVHWRANHYAAIIEERNGFYHVKDPIFGDDLWITQAAVDDEASGHFLALTDKLKAGWQTLDAGEAAKVFGMGTTGGFRDDGPKPCDDTCPPENKHMTGYSFSEMFVSLRLTDSPVGYSPPVGLSLYTTLTYNQRESSQPSNFSFFNISPKWSLNWLSYIQDDPAIAGASVKLMTAGGGRIAYGNYNASTGQFSPDAYDGATLKLVSSNPVVYQKLFSDGSVDEYRQSNGATTAPRLIFLSKRTDAQGNTLTFNYDAQKRLSSITDATGRNTTFSYTNANPLLITAITDPFGRSAQFSYDTSGRLASITDTIGIQSSFHYDAQSLIDSLTTPYGTTTFSYGESGTWRWLQATDPLGKTERLEFRQQVSTIPSSDPANTIPQGILNPFNAYLNSRNSFYWDKHAYTLALLPDGSLDYTKARIKHWVHWASDNNMVSPPVESIKYPNENRIWFNYPNQVGGLGTAVSGSLNKPIRKGRVLDDGSTQLYQYDYNSLGNITQAIDPLGRETKYTYAANQIDVIKIEQKTSTSGYSTIAQYTYNSQHLPLTYTDAAGQTTTYTYNAKGQLTQETNPLNQSTRYVYNTLGYLTSIINANNATIQTFTYSNTGNLASSTDSFSQTTQYVYDALDRITTITHPNLSTSQYTWDKLDKATVKDRENRVTRYQYDANRKLIRETNPLGQFIDYHYYPNGKLKSLTDENAQTTTWQRDIESRVTSKVFADNQHTDYVYENTTSRLKDTIDAKGQTKRLSYDLNNQITNINYLNPAVPTPNVSFSYDTYFPRLTSMSDGTGTTQYQYQAVGSLGALQLSQEDGSYQNDNIAYQYDALGRVATRTIGNTPETYSYDTLGRISNHTSVLGNFNRTYWGQTPYITGQHSVPVGGVTVGTDYDWCANCDYHLRGINHSGTARDYNMVFSPSNRISLIKETATSGISWYGYGYDAKDRLLNAQKDNGGYMPPAGSQFALSYDPADNLNQIQYVPSNQTTFAVNTVNQITTINNTVQTSYDNNGNMTKNPMFSNLQWDAENRLVKAEITPSTYYTFTYDGLSRRIKANYTQQGVTSESRYLWCGEEICQKRNNTDTVTGRYFDEGEWVGASGLKAYYAKDHLGSVRDVLDMSTGNVIRSLDYYPNGKLKNTSGTFEPEFEFAEMQSFPFMATGGALLTYYRVYDPTLGRWLSRDPIEEAGGVNLYGYVGGDPVNRIDPTGEYWVFVRKIAIVCGKQIIKWSKNWVDDIAKSKRQKNRIPDKGDPNTIAENTAGTTRKKYGDDGWVQKEWNKGHGSDAPINEQLDHIHDHKPNPYNPTGQPERQAGRTPRNKDLYDLGLLP